MCEEVIWQQSKVALPTSCPMLPFVKGDPERKMERERREKRSFIGLHRFFLLHL